MKERFKSALDRIEADEVLVSKTAARLRNELAQGQHPSTIKMNGRFYGMKKFVIAACMALLLMGGGFAYATPTSYLSVDINPSVELGINAIGRVVSVEAYGAAGENILEGLDLDNMKVGKAVSIIVDAAAEKGYLNDDGSSIVSLTAVTDDEVNGKKITADAEQGTQEALEENGQSAEVRQDAVALARHDAAEEAGISPGKMNLIQKLWEAQNPDETVTAENYQDILDFAQDEFGENTYAEASVKDIMKAIKDTRTDVDLNAGDVIDDEDEDIDEPGKGKANAPGQQLKAGTDTVDDQALTLPNGKVKKNTPDKNGD